MNSNKKKNIIIIAAAVFSIAIAASARGGLNQDLPRNDDVVTVHRTTPLIPEDGDDGNGVAKLWDFSGERVTEANIQWRYSWCGDTLLSETRPHVRRDYAVSGDSVSLVCTETPVRRIDARIDSRSPSGSGTFLERGRHMMTDSIWGNGSELAYATAVGDILLPDCEEPIRGARMHRFSRNSSRTIGRATAPYDSSAANLEWFHSEEVYIWRAPGLLYAVAETRVTTDSVSGRPAAVTIESFVCPPETQPLEAPTMALTQQRPMAVPPLPGADADGAAAGPEGEALTDVAVASTGETISLTGTSLVSGEASMTLCDIAGRVYAHRPAFTVEPGARVELSVPRPSDLPPGDYLLRVATPEATTVAKLLLR